MTIRRALIAIAMAGSVSACSSIDTINGVRMNVSREGAHQASFCG